MASIYERAPFFMGQKTWTEETPLGDVYKLQSNSPRNKQKAEIHKDSGQFGIEITLDQTINDFVRLAGNVGIVSGIPPPQNDVGADMLAPCRRHNTDHVGDIAPCRLTGRCVSVVSA
jgi:hypothetical protein